MKVFSPIVFAIVESSALYTLGVVTVLATLLSGSNGHYPAVNAIVPLVVSLCTFRLYLSDTDPIRASTSTQGHRLLVDHASDPLPCQRFSWSIK